MLNDKLSVVYLSPGWPLRAYPNGIVTYIQNIVSGFDEQVRPAIVTNNLAGENLEPFVIDLSQLHKNKSLFMRLCNKALWIKLTPKYIKNMCREYKDQHFCKSIVMALNSLDQKVDILEIEESFGRGRYLVEELDIPIITRLHGPWFIHGPIMKVDKNTDYQHRLKAEGNAINASHGITAPSFDVLNKVREFYGYPLANAKVIPNPVLPVLDENQWQYLPESRQTILVVGRFDLHKGGDLAIDAFRIVASMNQEVELLFVGPDRGVIINNKAYTFMSYVDTFVPEAAIKQRINFLGHCDSDKIAKLRKEATITMMPSRYDNFPMSLLEALATGSPVVATAVGGMKEIIIEDFNGLLAEPESAESLAENVLKLLGGSSEMRRLSQNAILDSKERFSPVVIAKQTEEYYKSVLKDYQSPPI